MKISRWVAAKTRARKYAAALTPEDDKRITQAALNDPDNPPLDDDFFKSARPAAEVDPEIVADQQRRRGRPKSQNTKIPVTLRLDPDVARALRASGTGWQTRLNEMLVRRIKRGQKVA